MQWQKLDYALQAQRGEPMSTALQQEPAMLDVLQGFVHELRVAGLPVSMTENLDAMRAVEYVPLQDRDAFKTALSATLVKHHGHHKVFDTVFEVYFSIFSPGVEGAESGEGGDSTAADFEQLRNEMDAGGAMGQVSNEELAQMLLDALMKMDMEALRALAGAAVARFAGMEPVCRFCCAHVPDFAPSAICCAV